jgi:hypothetical protein
MSLIPWNSGSGPRGLCAASSFSSSQPSAHGRMERVDGDSVAAAAADPSAAILGSRGVSGITRKG